MRSEGIGFDEADRIAAEHIRWCRGQGMGYAEIMLSIGRTADPAAGPDDVLGAVAEAWLELRLTVPRALRLPKVPAPPKLKKQPRRALAAAGMSTPLRTPSPAERMGRRA